jgi:REP element-mobilizing transposase RayT
MASTLVKIYVHLAFHVKSTGITIRDDDLEKVFSYLGGIIRGIGGAPIQIGGMPDHVHILSTLPKTLSLADFVRTIKSDSSKWIKSLDNYYQSFAWQEGYGAFSVSSSQMKNTIRYIQRQPEHHKIRTFNEEYRLFLEAYGIDYDERFAFKD